MKGTDSTEIGNIYNSHRRETHSDYIYISLFLIGMTVVQRVVDSKYVLVTLRRARSPFFLSLSFSTSPRIL